jgi:hypothetical protein
VRAVSRGESPTDQISHFAGLFLQHVISESFDISFDQPYALIPTELLGLKSSYEEMSNFSGKLRELGPHPTNAHRKYILGYLAFKSITSLNGVPLIQKIIP